MNATRFLAVFARVSERVLRLVGVSFVSLCPLSTFNHLFTLPEGGAAAATGDGSLTPSTHGR